MELISAERCGELVFGQPGEVRKLELRDHYEIDRKLFDAWRNDDREFLERRRIANEADVGGLPGRGINYRRVRVVSEPLSEYQRMAVEIANPTEQLRWLPRPEAAAIVLPVNDSLIRDDLVVFNLHGGNNESVGALLSTDPEVVKLCADAFEQAWSLGRPNGTYAP